MRWLILVSLPFTVACRNSCQQLCLEIRDYALDECGLEFTDDEVQTCLDEQKNKYVERETHESCDVGLQTLRDDWECEDLRDYFKSGGSSDADDTGG